MQDNQLHGNLTVEEAMKVATSLKLSSDLSKTHKEEVVRIFLSMYTVMCTLSIGFYLRRIVGRNRITAA